MNHHHHHRHVQRVADILESYQLLRAQNGDLPRSKIMIFVSSLNDADNLVIELQNRGMGPVGAAHYKLGGSKGKGKV